MKKIMDSFKILPFVYEFKTNLFFGVYLFGIGVVLILEETMFGEADFGWSFICIVVGPFTILQLLYSLLISKMISVSPKRRWLELTAPNGITGVVDFTSYVIIVSLLTVLISKQPESLDAYISSLFFDTICLILLNLYFTLCYKRFLISNILLLIFYPIFMVLYNEEAVAVSISNHFDGNWVRAVIECGTLAAIGFLASCLLRKAIYKWNISSYAAGFKLRRLMQ